MYQKIALNSKKIFRLAAIASHPVQYQAPLFRKLASHPQIKLKVYYCSDHGTKISFDPGFGIAFRYDISLIEGYQYEFLRNWSPLQFPKDGVKGLFNPGIILEILRGSYDAIFVHDFIQPTSLLACLAAFCRRVPVLFHGEALLLRPRPRPRWFQAVKRLYFTTLFRIPGRFLAIGSHNRDFYLHYGVDEGKIFLMPYCVDNEFFQQKAKACYEQSLETRRELGIPEGIPIVLFVGKLIDRKRPFDLVRGFERVRTKVEAALVFVGDGDQRAALEKYVEDKKIPDVHFVGFKNQTELSPYYLASDVFVLPSDWEPWGLVINEAMVHGLPVVASSMIGAAPDLVQPGENGFIYPVRNVNALTDCLSQILSSKEHREAMGRNSLKIISQWNYDVCVQGVLKALESLIENDF